MTPRDSGERVSAEQRRYATLLDWGAKTGFGILVAAFAAYVFELLPAHVAFEELPVLWTRPLDAYLAETGTPTGWYWLAHVAKGEFASLGGIAVLSGCSVVCLLAVIPIYARRGDRTLAAICALTIAVLLLAASGILTAGH
jgi:hypothetical protein